MIKMLLLLELLPFCFLFFLHSPSQIVAEQPPGQSPELQHLDAVAPVQAAPPAPSLPGPADGNGNSSSASSQAAASRFVPLLRQGHLVEAKFNQPTGPLQARLSFGQREKNGGKGGKEQEQARRQGQPAVGGQQGRGPFSTRAIFSGRDPSSGAFFRKRFNATLSDGGKKRSGIRDGDQNAGKAIRDGDQDILELGSGRSSDEDRQPTELKERPPADRLVVEPRKVGEEKPKAEENAKKDEAKKEEPKVNGITLESGAVVKEVKEEKKPVEEPKKAEEEQQKRAEEDNSADQARRSEEWNGWGFLPSFFQWEGARKSEAANDQSQQQQQQQPNGNNQSSSQLQVRPSGGAVQLQPAAGDQGGRAASAPAKCQDQAENCVDNRAFCRVSPYEELMAENCAKTCELCAAGEEGAKGGGNETANGEEEKAREREAKKEEEKAKQQPAEADAEKPAEQSKPVEDESSNSNCRDLSSRCSQWAQRGFCASRFFHRDLKARFCAKSCALCGNGEKKEGGGGEQ